MKNNFSSSTKFIFRNQPSNISQHIFNFSAPINIFATRTASANPPLRVSYHRQSHYNSVIDPFTPTIGVGLGLPSFHPGVSRF